MARGQYILDSLRKGLKHGCKPLFVFSALLLSVFFFSPISEAEESSSSSVQDKEATEAVSSETDQDKTLLDKPETSPEKNADNSEEKEAAVPDSNALVPSPKAEATPTEISSGNVSVRINKQQLSPDPLLVKPGTTVAWINSGEHLAKVRFTNEAVSTTCKAPRGFILGTKGIYESGEILSGEVASICLLEPIIYTYEVDFLDSGEGDEQKTKVGETLHGRIEVRR